MVRALCAAAGILGVTATTHAAAPEWVRAALPGGMAPIQRILNLGEAPVPPERFVLELARSAYNLPETQPRAIEGLTRLRLYLDSLARIRRVLRRRGDPAMLVEAVGFVRAGDGTVVADGRPPGAARRAALALAGFDVERLAAHLAEGAAPPEIGRDETIPLPLDHARWKRLLGQSAPAGAVTPVEDDEVLLAILGDRNAVFLYAGLMALDGDTLRLVASADLLRTIHREHAAAFAAAARSLRVKNAAIDVRGDLAMRAAWESLVGEQVETPQRFIRALLARDRGRLALFYDLVTHLSEPAFRFVAGGTAAAGHQPETINQRLRTLRRLYEIFSLVDVNRRIEDSPFSRQTVDLAFLLHAIWVDDEGRLDVPGRWDLWQEAFRTDELPEAVSSGSRLLTLSASHPLGPIELAELVCLNPPQVRRARFNAVQFIMRVSRAGAAPRSEGELLAMVRGFGRYPALMLTLERMAIRDPALFVRAAYHARALERIPDSRRRTVSIALFQGALAVLDRARFTRVLDVAASESLLASLLDVGAGAGSPSGGVGRWLRDRAIPILTARTAPSQPARGFSGGRTAEDVVIDTLAGAGSAVPGPLITWEATTYHVDVAAGERRRIRRAREKQAGDSLDAVLSYQAAVEELRRQWDPAGMGAVETAFRKLVRGSSTAWWADNAIAEIEDVLGRWPIMTGARRAETLDRLAAAGDALLAQVLAAMVYAVHLGDPDELILVEPNLATRHDFGAGLADLDQRRRRPWTIPAEQSGTGLVWHVAGSLLGLDIGLARLSLRRIVTNRIPPAPRLATNDRQAFAEQVVLMNPFDTTDANRDTIARALARGRDRIRQLTRDPIDLPAVAARLGLDAWRAQALAWVLGVAPDRAPALFSLSELFWLGLSDDTSPDTRKEGPGAADGGASARRDVPRGLDTWGASMVSIDGCLCTRLRASGTAGRSVGVAAPPQELLGRAANGFVAAVVPDLALRIAELLSEHDLPAALARGILGAAAQDLVDETQPLHHADWQTVAASAQRLTRERFADYVSALASNGPLVLVR